MKSIPVRGEKLLNSKGFWKGRKCLILGAGLSGLAAYDLLKFVGSELYIIDDRSWESLSEKLSPYGIEGHQFLCWSNLSDQEKALQLLEEYTDLILSPGIPRTHKLVQLTLAKKRDVWSEIELAFSFCDVPVLCITGTNGKTTTTSMLGELLTASDHRCFVGGNIGRPFCEYALERLKGAKFDEVVLELSSFQLETASRFKANIALILNIKMNHGERYESINSYAQAKFHIADGLTEKDHFLVPKDDILITDWISRENISQRTNIHFINFEKERSKLLEEYCFEKFSLKGTHNLDNLIMAKKACSLFLDDRFEKKSVQKVINEFQAPLYRLQKLEDSILPPLEIYNDSKCTNDESLITALRAFESDSRPILLILGGQIRGRYVPLLPKIQKYLAGVEQLYFMGEAAPYLSKEFKDTGISQKTFENIVEVHDELVNNYSLGANSSSIVLFAPAFPSFDQYPNFMKRGEHFNSLFSSHVV